MTFPKLRNSTKNALWGAVVLILFIALGFQFSPRRAPQLSKANSVATLIEFNGVVQVRPREEIQFQNLEGGESFWKGDRIQTGAQGFARLSFPTGDEVMLFANSLIYLDYWDQADPPITISVEKGNLQFAKTGKAGQLYILMKDKLYTPSQWPTGENWPSIQISGKNPSKPSVVPVRAESKTPAGESAAPGVLPQMLQVFADKILAQRDRLEKCYLDQAGIQSKDPLKITAVVQVQNSGSVSQVQFTEQELIPSLAACLKDVFLRIKFNRFEGDPILLTQPLTLE